MCVRVGIPHCVIQQPVVQTLFSVLLKKKCTSKGFSLYTYRKTTAVKNKRPVRSLPFIRRISVALLLFISRIQLYLAQAATGPRGTACWQMSLLHYLGFVRRLERCEVTDLLGRGRIHYRNGRVRPGEYRADVSLTTTGFLCWWYQAWRDDNTGLAEMFTYL